MTARWETNARGTLIGQLIFGRVTFAGRARRLHGSCNLYCSAISGRDVTITRMAAILPIDYAAAAYTICRDARYRRKMRKN